jgi:predicted esterase
MRVVVCLLLAVLSGCVVDLAPGAPDESEGEGEGEAGEGEAGEGEGEEGEGEAGEGEGEAGEGEGEAGEGEAGEGEGEGEAGALVPGTSRFDIAALGLNYSGVLVVPEAASRGPVPLVVAFHGNGDTAENFIASKGLAQIAESQGFVLAVPQGIARPITAFGQNLGTLSWDAYNTPNENPDIVLFDELVQQLMASNSIDPRRCHVLGYSQGGYLAFHIAMARSETVASGVVIAASDPLGGQLAQSAVRAIPMGLRVGSNDFAATALRADRDRLAARGHEVVYEEISGAGHVPLPGDVATLFAFLVQRQLP